MPDAAKSPAHLVITGASGYIGRRLVEMACARGDTVTVLGTPPSGPFSVRSVPWRLGDLPPPEALRGVTAVIHLGHSWSSDREAGISPENVNIRGSLKLAEAAMQAGVPRFVFASTTSARPTALNAYGRIKDDIEKQLFALPAADGRMTAARIGLVYGGKPGGQYALLLKLVRLPLLPVVGANQLVQPIHIDEVCRGLMALATAPLPSRDMGTPKAYVIAGPHPVTFGSFLRLLGSSQTGKRPTLLPLPLSLALRICRLSRIVPFLPTIIDEERILGIAALKPMDSQRDLRDLGVCVFDSLNRLMQTKAARRQKTAEAFALLSYLAGRRIKSIGTVARLRKGIERVDSGAIGLPRFILTYPPLLRLLDPWRPGITHRLGQRLHLAAMVLESTAGDPPERPSIFASAAQLVLDSVALPFRLAFRRWFA